MDLGSAIIGIICIVVFTMPFVLERLSRKKRDQKMLASIQELAKQQNCKITQYEVCGNYVIGIDEAKNFLFYNLKQAKQEIKQFVKLSSIRSSSINKILAGNNAIEKINLELKPIDNNKPEILLEFYNIDFSFQLSGELQSIEKWSKLITQQLNANK